MLLQNFLGLALPWFGKSFFGNNHKQLLSQLSSLAQDLTGEKGSNAYKTLLNDSERLLAFQKHALSIQSQYIKGMFEDRKNARARDIMHLRANGKNARADFMIYIASFALFSCIAFIWFCRHILSVELVGVISALVGIFGSCLKDAYVFEFGANKMDGKMSNIYEKFIKPQQGEGHA